MSIPFYETKHGYEFDYAVSFYNGGSGFPPHLHRCFELIVSLGDGTTVKIDGKPYVLEKNDLLIIKPYQVHEIYNSKLHFYYLFSPELIPAVSEDLRKYELTSPLIKNVGDIPDKLLVRLEKANISLKKGIIYYFCSYFLNNVDYTKATQKTKDRTLLQRIFAFVEDNSDNTCKIENLSKELDYAPSYLSRMFKSSVGLTFSDYVRRIKIAKACNYLTDTDLPVLETAGRCGFNSLSSFNRAFKAVTGINPTEYRRQKAKSHKK